MSPSEAVLSVESASAVVYVLFSLSEAAELSADSEELPHPASRLAVMAPAHRSEISFLPFIIPSLSRTNCAKKFYN